MKIQEQDIWFYGMCPTNTVSFLEYPEDPGYCLDVYFIGCSHGCEGCQNSTLRVLTDESSKVLYSSFVELLRGLLGRLRTKRVCLLGGDPLYITNRLVTKHLIEDMKDVMFCVYTGYDIEEVKDYVAGAKYVKCGVYDSSQRQIPCKNEKGITFASKNQKLYDSEMNLISKDGIYMYR